MAFSFSAYFVYILCSFPSPLKFTSSCLPRIRKRLFLSPRSLPFSPPSPTRFSLVMLQWMPNSLLPPCPVEPSAAAAHGPGSEGVAVVAMGRKVLSGGSPVSLAPTHHSGPRGLPSHPFPASLLFLLSSFFLSWGLCLPLSLEHCSVRSLHRSLNLVTFSFLKITLPPAMLCMLCFMFFSAHSSLPMI